MSNKILIALTFFSISSFSYYSSASEYKTTISSGDMSVVSNISDNGISIRKVSSYPILRKCKGFYGSFDGDSLSLKNSLIKKDKENFYTFEGEYKILDCKELTFKKYFIKDTVKLSNNENFFGIYQRDKYIFNITLDRK